MTTTTSYGTWANFGDGELTVEDNINSAVGEYAADYDLPALTKAYREAINEALPGGISLYGNEFYGPHPHVDGSGDEIRAVIAGTDFWGLASKYDRHAPLVARAKECIDELLDRSSRHAVVLVPDCIDGGSWDPEICVINLDDDEATDQPYVVLIRDLDEDADPDHELNH
jgi:hypothetical protein